MSGDDFVAGGRRIDRRLVEVCDDIARPFSFRFDRDLSKAEQRLVQHGLDGFIAGITAMEGQIVVQDYRGCQWLSESELLAHVHPGLDNSHVFSVIDGALDRVMAKASNLEVYVTFGDDSIEPPAEYQLTAKPQAMWVLHEPTPEQRAAAREGFAPRPPSRTVPSKSVKVELGSKRWDKALGFRFDFNRPMTDTEQRAMITEVERWRVDHFGAEGFDPETSHSWVDPSSLVIEGKLQPRNGFVRAKELVFTVSDQLDTFDDHKVTIRPIDP
ncbi:MAG: hypothetical protein WA964_18670 [Ilumatobacter sp.]|uniref:hypothetical protein n=1 Tax=Ilumatobacter sp. TaxID=1967498 RepID=UPI003C76E00E